MADALDGTNCYEVLQVSESASTEELRQAYLAAARRAHPDKADGQDAGTTARFQQLQRAWQVLKEPESRAAHDRQLALRAARAQVAICDDLALADLQPGSPAAAPASLWHACRCGGAYWLGQADLAVQADSLVLPCDTCSLHVRVWCRPPPQ